MIPFRGGAPRVSLECMEDVPAGRPGGTFVLRVGGKAWGVRFLPGPDVMGQWTCSVRALNRQAVK